MQNIEAAWQPLSVEKLEEKVITNKVVILVLLFAFFLSVFFSPYLFKPTGVFKGAKVIFQKQRRFWVCAVV